MSIRPFAVAVVICSLLLGCNAPEDSSTPKDIASEAEGSFLYYYFIDGADLVRTRCSDALLDPTRLTCSERRRQLPLREVRVPVYSHFINSLAEQDARVVTLATKIARIDLKIAELLASGSSTNADRTRALQAKIDQLETKIVALNHHLSELAAQIADIERRLESQPNGDLVKQLANLRTTRQNEESQLNDRSRERDAARTELIALASDIVDQQTFDLVKSQRSSAVRDWDAAKTEQDHLLQKVVTVDRLFAYMADAGMTYEQRPSRGQSPFDHEILFLIEHTFADITDHSSKYGVSANIIDPRACGATCDIQGTWEVESGRRLAKVWCEFHVQGGTCPYPRIKMPSGRTLPGRGLDRDVAADVQSFPGAFDEDVQGEWHFQETCQRTGNLRPNLVCWVVVD